MSLSRRQRLLGGALLSLAIGTGVGSALAAWIDRDGWAYDVALALRAGWRPTSNTVDRAVAVIAIDEDSLASPELARLPRALFGPVWGALLDATVAAGARAVGFDLILAWSSEQLIPGHDETLLQALDRAADRVVLGRSAQLPPAVPFFYAAGGGGDEAAAGLIELAPDPDGVSRRVAMVLETSDGPALTLAGALLRRIGRTAPETVRLAPRDRLEALPTYPLASVLACAGSPALRERLEGRVVLIGTTLREEDRRLAPDRFMGQAAESTLGACAGQPPAAAPTPGGATVPGVYLHAAAVSQAMAGEAVRELGPPFVMAATAAAAAMVVWMAIGWKLQLAIVGYASVLCLLAGAVLVAFTGWGIWLPPAAPAAATLPAMIAALAFRYVWADRDRRHVERAFGHYLAPQLVEQLAAQPGGVRLGGELRSITVLFTDLAGFTTLSEQLGPEELARRINDYFSRVDDAVMAHGGLVNDFIGDAVLALFGAPLPDADHAAHAMACARALDDAAEAFRREQVAQGVPWGVTRIGLHSGAAVVGNFGAPRRLKYSAFGDVVNAASRIEGLNKHFGTRLCASRVTADLAQDGLVRPLGRIRLKGMQESLECVQILHVEEFGADHLDSYREAYARLDRGEPAGLRALDALARQWPEDHVLRFHLGRLTPGSRVDTLVVMTDK